MGAGEQIDGLKRELELARQAATELEAASPHSVPGNGCMEQNQEASLSPIPDEHEKSVPDHYGIEQQQSKENMERELEGFRDALSEREAECSQLRRQLADLQRDFEEEEPAPTSDLPAPPAPDIKQVIMSYCYMYGHTRLLAKAAKQVVHPHFSQIPNRCMTLATLQ